MWNQAWKPALDSGMTRTGPRAPANLSVKATRQSLLSAPVTAGDTAAWGHRPTEMTVSQDTALGRESMTRANSAASRHSFLNLPLCSVPANLCGLSRAK